jgi:hypothetical protein
MDSGQPRRDPPGIHEGREELPTHKIRYQGVDSNSQNTIVVLVRQTVNPANLAFLYFDTTKRGIGPIDAKIVGASASRHHVG